MEQNNSTANKVFSGIFWKLGERVLAQVVSFIVSVILARILMPEEYGLVSMVLIFITIADVFVSSGFGTALIQKKDAENKDFSTIFYCSLLMSILVYSVLFVSAPFIAKMYSSPKLTLIIRVLALRLPISAYNTVQHAFVSRHMIFKRFFVSTLFGTILSGIVGIIMAVNGMGVWSLIAQYMVNTVVDSIVLTFTIEWRPRLEFSWNNAKNMMKYGWNILLADLSGTFFEQLRSLIIGKVYTASDLAYYNKGKQMPSLISDNVSVAVMTALFPALANESDDIEKVKIMVRKAFKMMTYIIFPLMIGLIMVSRSLILVLLTEKWSDCVIYMQLLSLSCMVTLIGNTSLQSIKAIGRSDVLLKLEIYKKPIYVILLVAGAYYSVLGIAITSLIYSIYGVTVNSIALKKLIGYGYKEMLHDILHILIAVLFMALVIWIVSFLDFPDIIMLFLKAVSGFLTYISISRILKIEEYYYLISFIKAKFKINKKR